MVIEINKQTEKEKDGIVYAVLNYPLPFTESREHQLWYVDQSTCTIRNKATNHCLDVKDDKVILNPYQRRNSHQRWVIKGSRIQSKDEPDSVLGIVDAQPQEGSKIHLVDHDGSEGQSWDYDHTNAEYFFIKCQDSDRVLEVAGADDAPGTKAIVYQRQDFFHDHQLWYEDEKGIIRSKLHDFALTIEGKSLLSQEEEVCLTPFEEQNEKQKWITSGSSIQNQLNCDEVLEFKGGGWFTNPYLIPAEYNGNSNQLWVFDYCPNQIMSLSHPGIGKWVRICSKLSGHFMSISDGNVESGTEVIMWDRKSDQRESNDQLWSLDSYTGTIRSALHDYCLDLRDEHLVVNPYQSDNRNQQWKVTGMRIHCMSHPEKALQIEGNDEEIGARLTVLLSRGVKSQLWEVQHVPARVFYIKNAAVDKVMTVKGDNRDSGSQVVNAAKKEKKCPTQLWYEDQQDYIRSAFNGYVFDSADDNNIHLTPFRPGEKSQQWIIEEDFIQHRIEKQLTLDVKRGWTLDNTNIVAIEKSDKDTQCWIFEYM